MKYYMNVELVSIKTQHLVKKTMDFLGNPSKKIKLDLSNYHDGNFGNDDLWGAEDITAEEFDMLQTQATQKLAGGSTNTFRQPCSTTNGPTSTVPSKKEEMLQQQYELEGRIKILSESVKKLSKELKEEKLNKDKIISQKNQEFHQKENVLQKEIEKLKISLQFKDQEMKTISDKAHFLEFQLKERKEIQEKDRGENLVKEKTGVLISPQLSKIQASGEFSKRFKFESEHSIHTSNEQNSSKGSFRKFKLHVNTQKGKTQGCDIVSSILCNRLVIPPTQSSFFQPLTSNQCPDVVATSSYISAVSIARLNSNKQTEELLDYFNCLLNNYLTHLKAISCRTSIAGPKKSSPLSLRRKELQQDRTHVISNLKDLALFLSCHQFASLTQKLEFAPGNLNESNQIPEQKETFQTPNIQSSNCDKKIVKLNERMHSLLQILVCLSNPNTYPSGFPKNEEVEWSLTSLVSWSSTASESLIQFAREIPFVPLVNSDHSVKSLGLVLQLLTNISAYKGIISIIMHQDDVCVLCAIAHLVLLKISTSPLKYSNIMIKVEDFLSVLFTLYSFTELRLESSPCSSLILEGIVTSLWKFYETRGEKIDILNQVFKKGFTLLHLMSRYFPNFKGRRVAFEDYYISLVCGMLKLTKENSFFKDFYDLIHDLWDFQDDTSEFDLDEPCEDSTQNVSVLSQNNS